MTFLTPKSLTAFCLAGVAVSTPAADLMDTWRWTQARDPALASARAVSDQAADRQAQAEALWKPQVKAGATVGLGGQDGRTTGAQSNGMSPVSFDTSINAGLLSRASIGAQKAWIDPERELQSQQLNLSADIARVQWQQAQQTAMLQSAQKYFDVLRSEQILAISIRQQQTVEQVAKEIQRRQRIGDATLMDLQEAQARVANVNATVLQARNEVALKRVSYRLLTGQTPGSFANLGSDRSLFASATSPVTYWLQAARGDSPRLQLMALQVQLQELEARRLLKSGTEPTVNWVAQAQLDRLAGPGIYGSSMQQMTNYVVGVQLQIPLSTGGMVEARAQEAMKQVDKLRYDQESLALQTETQVQEAWQEVSTAEARLQALAAALKASQARLDATRQAHRMGTRTTMEWLGAEQDAAVAELAWVQLRFQTVLQRLQLEAVSGILSESGLQKVNALLQ